jgi:hypothetical protein
MESSKKILPLPEGPLKEFLAGRFTWVLTYKKTRRFGSDNGLVNVYS